jgi:HK97 family phage prohead protease
MNHKLFIDSSFTVTKAEDEDDGYITISGYANTTDKDRGGDVILSSAWNRKALKNYKANPIILGNHDYSNPIGKAVEMDVTDKGLHIVAKISKSVGVMADLIAQGIIKAFSVGFMAKDADYDSATDIFVIKELELYEISVVAVGANQNSLFSVKKSLSADQLDDFKKEILNPDASNKEVIASKNEAEDKIEEIDMDKLTELEAKIKDLTDKLANSGSDVAATVLSALHAEKAAEEAVQLAAKEAADKKEALRVEVTTGAESLVAEVEKRLKESFDTENKTLKETLAGLETDLKEKAAEITAMQTSKMTFGDRSNARAAAQKDIDTAVITAKIMGVPITETSFAKGLIEKTGPHLASMTEDWEETFTTNMVNDIREKLIIEPMFRQIAMPTPTMHLPINPEAGYGEWIAGTYPPLGSGNYADGNPGATTDGDSTGDAVKHLITDTSLTAHKLASKEYLAYEEEEDSIIALAPIINDAIRRRMAKSSDKALLRGLASGATDPLSGICTLAAATGGAAQTTMSVGGGDKTTVSILQTVRRGLGVYGTDPMDVIYIVSNDSYFDLLEDPDFRTMDLVGDKATILRGQIGSVNGSPVVISGEFEAKAATKHCAVAVNTSNFIVGNVRTMLLEKDKDIVNQTNVLVATRRMAFKQLLADASASVLTWAA